MRILSVVAELFVKNLYVCVCPHLHSCSCKDKFVQECGVVRLLEVARCNFLLRCN